MDPGGKTQEGNPNLPVGAGKNGFRSLQKVAEAAWPPSSGAAKAADPWGSAKASRWMSAQGQSVVRAGLAAWTKLKEEDKATPRERAVLVTGVEGAWPGWLKGRSPQEIAQEWRTQPPLWLLEGLPNLPAAQLAIEITARGPVESRRGRPEDDLASCFSMERWTRRGIRRLLWVRWNGTQACAEVWSS